MALVWFCGRHRIAISGISRQVKTAQQICDEVNPLLPHGFRAQCSIGVAFSGKSSAERVSISYKGGWLRFGHSTPAQRKIQRDQVRMDVEYIVKKLKTMGYQIYNDGTDAIIVP